MSALLPNLRFAHLAILLLVCSACTAVQNAPPAERGVVLKRSYEFTDANKSMEYALYVPKSYKKKTATPLIVLLHGLGSNPQQVINYDGITEQAEKRGYIVAAPFGYNAGGWYGSRGQGKDFGGGLARQADDVPNNLGELSEKDVLNVLNLVRKEFNVDKRRIYLMGHSMGGGGSLYLGIKHKEIWAALAPMAPAIWSSPDELAAIPKMPIIVVQGDQDNLVPVDRTRRWIAKMSELNMPYKYIEIKDGNHVQSISRNAAMITEVFDFLDLHTR
ncbi:MAG: alpha/beta hydrolase [Candidatus Obscuribacterales bacterium]|nr:alpha/beta hydrolase [Steroidobacteraceae bacterium]